MKLKSFLLVTITFFISFKIIDYLKIESELHKKPIISEKLQKNADISDTLSKSGIKNLLSLSFSDEEAIQNYKINDEKDKLFLVILKNNSYTLKMINLINGKTTNILESPNTKYTYINNNWFTKGYYIEEEKTIEKNLNLYMFQIENDFFFVNKNSGKLLKSITNAEEPSLKFSHDCKKFFYVRKNPKKLEVSFYCLDLISFKEKMIFTKKCDLDLLKKETHLEDFLLRSNDFRSSNFKIFENSEKKEIFIFAVDELKIFDYNSFELKRSIIPKDNKNTPLLFDVKVIAIDNKNNRVLIGKHGYGIDVLELKSSLKYSFYSSEEFRYNLGNVSIEFSKDSKYVLQVGDDDAAYLFDFKTKKILAILRIWYEANISADSKYVIYNHYCEAGIDCTVSYDIKTQSKKILEERNTVKPEKNFFNLKNDKQLSFKETENYFCIQEKYVTKYIYETINFFIDYKSDSYPIFKNKDNMIIMTRFDKIYIAPINISQSGKYFFILYETIDMKSKNNNVTKVNFDFFSVN